jgi:hypothetical protein
MELRGRTQPAVRPARSVLLTGVAIPVPGYEPLPLAMAWFPSAAAMAKAWAGLRLEVRAALISVARSSEIAV